MQKIRKVNYDDWHHTSSKDIWVGGKELLRNNTRNDSKGGKFCFKLQGPYIVLDITKPGRALPQNKNGDCLNPYQTNFTII